MQVNFPTMAVLIRSSWTATTLALAIASAACGGSEDAGATQAADGVQGLVGSDAQAQLPPQDPAQLQAQLQYCAQVPAPAALGPTRPVRDFGAKPNDDEDDTAAIQQALDAGNPGETIWFAPGRYLISRSLRVRRPGLAVSGESAVIHATNPDDQALLIEADGTRVSSLTFTASTQGRRTAPRHARIAVVAGQPDGSYRTIRDTEIRGNRIVNAGAPGTAEANSASSAGIMLFHADGFLVADNTVVRTLADGIHITAGSRNGRVLNNIVHESGDDMIAVVSYAQSGAAAQNSAADLLQSWDSRVERGLNRNILIADNHASGQYWGRGISVVGGQAITIRRNTLENVPTAAAILIAREANYQTFGIQNVLIDGNVIREVQTLVPSYDPVGKYSTQARTGHGAIEVQAALFDDEAAEPALRSALSVRNVVVRDNTVERSGVSGVRAGVNMSGAVTATSAAGLSLTRRIGQGAIERLSVQRNRFAQLAGTPIAVLGGLATGGIHCRDNQIDGRAYSIDACKATSEPVPVGADLKCSADGRML
jgi:polygalacturonase